MQEVQCKVDFRIGVVYSTHSYTPKHSGYVFKWLFILYCKRGRSDKAILTVEKQTTYHSYRMMTFSITLGMEYVALFLLDFYVARPLWDPLFLKAKEIEKQDSNNRVLQIVYKPVDLLNFPWFLCIG